MSGTVGNLWVTTPESAKIVEKDPALGVTTSPNPSADTQFAGGLPKDGPGGGLHTWKLMALATYL